MDCYIYISYISHNFTKNNLLELLTTFQNNNKLNNITGILLYHCGNIIQLFEGPVDKTKQLLSNLKQDPLHTRFKILLHEPITIRTFPEWEMGFITKNSEYYNKVLFKQSFNNPKISILFKTFQKIINYY
jgi:hypothetical protein